MFVKWSCGCKGFIVDGNCWVINNCDQDISGPYEPLGICKRGMVAKTHEPLPYKEVCSLLIEMGHLISDGYAFRQLQSLLARDERRPNPPGNSQEKNE